MINQLASGMPITLRVATSSMTPEINPGDFVTIAPQPEKDFSFGDILLIKQEKEWVIHRLISIKECNGELYATTIGDNAIYADPSIPAKNILGKVVHARRKNKDVSLSCKTPLTNIDNVLLLASLPFIKTPAIKDITNIFKHEDFIATADAECLAPLIHFYHRDLNGDTWHAMQDKYLKILSRNTVFLDSLQIIAQRLGTVKFILLKGAFLAFHLYPSYGLRQFSDIDILIKPSETPTVHEKLLQLGYNRITGSEQGGNIPNVSMYLNSALYRSSKPEMPHIHVHWHLANSITPKYKTTNINMEKIWHSAVTTSHKWLSLSPEHLMIHLCEHAIRHSFDRLILIRDIAEVMVSKQIDWNQLVDDCRNFGLTRHVYYSLVYLSRKTGITAPLEIIEKLRPVKPGICGRLFLKLATNGIRRPELCNLVYMESETNSLDRLKYIIKTFFPPKQVLAHAYGLRHIGPFTYGFRIIRSIIHITKTIINILLKIKTRKELTT